MAAIPRATIGNAIIALLAWTGSTFSAEQGIEHWLAHGTRTEFRADTVTIGRVGRVLAMSAPEAGTLHAELTLYADPTYAAGRYTARLERAGNALRVTVDRDPARDLTRINITGPASPPDSVTAPLFRWVPGDRVLLVPTTRDSVPARLDAWELTLDTKEGGDSSGAAKARSILAVVFPIAFVAGAIAALWLAMGAVFRKEPAAPPLSPEAVVDHLIASLSGANDADSERLRKVARLIQAGQDLDAIIAQVPLDMKVPRDKTAPQRAASKLWKAIEDHRMYLVLVQSRIPTGLRQ
jgi:hypothetical protein